MTAQRGERFEDQPVDTEHVAAIGRAGLSVGVFCSAYVLPEKYTEPVREFVGLLAEHGHTIVWGGSGVGLMEVVASTAQEKGARIIGVSVDFLRKYARNSADEMIFANTLDERKDIIVERSDILAVLIGGTGTLDEITDVIEQNKHSRSPKPVLILNTDGFYNGLQTQFERMEEDGMLKLPLTEIIHFAETPQQATDYVNSFLPEPQ